MFDQMKFSMSLRYTLGRFVFKFHKNQMSDDVIMTSFKFSPNNCSSNLFEPTNFVLGTNTQQHNLHLMITRGQRPNESQKAVIIDMMKSG